MKTLAGGMLAALLLAAPVIADAATASNAAVDGGSTRSVYGANASRPYAILDFQNDTHLMPTSPVSRDGVQPLDGTLRLLNRTGSGR